jgi:predicted NBD/HSP70 family sugar kinase
MRAAGSLRDLRRANTEAVLSHLRRHGPASRADLARRTGLARATISSLVGQLIRDGLLEEAPKEAASRQPGSGRPPTIVHLTSAQPAVLGVEFGHSHVRVAVGNSIGILSEQCARVDVDHQANSALATLGRLAQATLADAGVPLRDLAGVGLGLPGPIDPRTDEPDPAVLPGWRGINPCLAVEDHLGVPVVVDNDANLAARGEHAYGAARGLRDFIFVKIDDGVGAGIVLGGRVYRGTSGKAGEIGHVQAVADGELCRCRNRGCLETEVSAPRLAARLAVARGESIEIESVLGLAANGDTGAGMVLAEAGYRTGEAVASLVTSLDPAAIVVGGALGAADSLVDGLRESVHRLTPPSMSPSVCVLPSNLGQRAGVLGAVTGALDAFVASSRQTRRL